MSRWKRSETTFGPIGRVLASLRVDAGPPQPGEAISDREAPGRW
jgi:hypothetical protein